MKSYPNELETYSYHFPTSRQTHQRSAHQQQHQHNHYNDDGLDEYSKQVYYSEHVNAKETLCDECTVITSDATTASGCSAFQLLPIILICGVIALAIVLLISAAVLYFQYLPFHNKSSNDRPCEQMYCESCEQMNCDLPFHNKSINDRPCEQMYCAYGAQCIVDESTKRAYCRCSDRCNPELFAPVCGNDGVTYSSVCRMNIRSCSEQKRIFVSHTGSCDMKDPCLEKECGFGAQCKPSMDGRSAECVCPTRCATYGDSRGSRPVCGTDGRDYPNVCELRRHSCKDMRDVTVKFTGACDPCDGVECPSSQICQLDDHRNPICRCNAVCNKDFKPVCGSDGKTYTNECILRVEACKLRRSLRIIHNGVCGDSNPCATLQCTQFQECEIDRYGIATCQCPPPCPPILRPVCGNDAHTYDSECDLQRQACLLHKDIHLAYAGNCGDDGPCSKSSSVCRFGAICVIKPNGEPACECPTCSEEFKPICGSDGISYSNECKMRLEACEQKKSIDLSYTDGLCNGCENKNCEFYSVCESDGSGGKCICPQSCVFIDAPVCGSDGITYDNECELRVAACKKSEFVSVVSKGRCDVCLNVHCKYGARCENGRCVCPTDCPDVFEPICGNDTVTYVNECEMRTAACRQRVDIAVKFFGECDDIVGSGSGSGGYAKFCDLKTCRYGGVCDYDENGVPHCLCSYHCPPSGQDSEPVCGSDGRLYDNECKLQEEACTRQQEIKPQEINMCQEVKILPCDGEPPLVNPINRKEYFCGDGQHSKPCPPNSYCHKGNNFAKCCREVATVRSCVETTYGCCPDGKTAAQGNKNAGCPSVCGCNRLGSYSLSCDPTTKQCHCKPGVGGLRCDRCEAGFWGLHKISEGNSGCIPCACNEHGSVRDDCEQMTGRCVCKVGIQGMKCDVCPEGTILGPDGCTDASLTKTIFGSCSDVKCSHGAVCRVKEDRGVQCVCDLKCPVEEAKKAMSVCGSDGNTYGSECQMRLFSCRYQKRITSRHDGSCKTNSTESVTAGPVRRSTMFKTTSDSEKSTREVSLQENIDLSTGPTVPTETLTDILKTPFDTPVFDGQSYIEMPRFQAYTRLSLEIELITLNENGIILYNGQTSSGEGDFVSLSIKDLHIEFRYNLGSGTVILRSHNPIKLGQVVKVVAKRYLWDGILSIEGQEDVSGRSEGALKSLDLAENLFLGFVTPKEKRVFENIGVNVGFVGCIQKFKIGRKDMDLRYPLSKDIIRVVHINECANNPCSSNPLRKSTREVNIPENIILSDGESLSTHTLPDIFKSSIEIPAFDGQSYIEMPRFQAYTRLSFEIEFRAFNENGIILYNGQTSLGDGDFVSLAVRHSHVEFRYNLGGGTVILKSVKPIKLGQLVKVVAKRYLWDGSLSVDDQEEVSGKSQGALNSLDLAENLFLGFVPSKEKRLFENISVNIGFVGCIHKFRIGKKDVDLRYPSSNDIIKIFRIRECTTNPCSSNP